MCSSPLICLLKILLRNNVYDLNGVRSNLEYNSIVSHSQAIQIFVTFQFLDMFLIRERVCDEPLTTAQNPEGSLWS